jgi:hypothetical protein
VIGIFKQKSPANIFLLLVFGFLIKLPLFLHPQHAITGNGDGGFYKALTLFLAPVSKAFPYLYAWLAFGFLFLQAMVLTRFMNTQRLVSKPTYFPGMAYLLITSLIPQWNYFSAPLIVNTIFVFVLAGLFKIYNQQNAKGAIFNIGLALGISSFIFFPSITFIGWILMALMVMRPFRINEWVLCILGTITPLYFYAVYVFISGTWGQVNFWPNFSIVLPNVGHSLWLAGSAFLLVVPFLAGAFFVQNNLRRMLIHARKGWSLLLLYILGAIFVPFVNSTGTFENWVIAAVPFAAFHACAYLYSSYRIIPFLLFWVTVAFVLAYQYAGPRW